MSDPERQETPAIEQDPGSSITNATIELAQLATLSPSELLDEWRRRFDSEPPRLSADMLVRAIAYRIQENDRGGLSKSVERQLASVAIGGADATPVLKHRIRPGTRFVREWRGRTHVVTAGDDGFEYQGKQYPSLTRIAQKITGAHWSGPRFFGSKARTGSTSLGSKVSLGESHVG